MVLSVSLIVRCEKLKQEKKTYNAQALSPVSSWATLDEVIYFLLVFHVTV